MRLLAEMESTITIMFRQETETDLPVPPLPVKVAEAATADATPILDMVEPAASESVVGETPAELVDTAVEEPAKAASAPHFQSAAANTVLQKSEKVIEGDRGPLRIRETGNGGGFHKRTAAVNFSESFNNGVQRRP